jgi:hypothetical protein
MRRVMGTQQDLMKKQMAEADAIKERRRQAARKVVTITARLDKWPEGDEAEVIGALGLDQETDKLLDVRTLDFT